METTTISRVSTLIALYDLHTDYYKKAIEGITATDAHNRLNTKANHVAWLAGSLLQERYELANNLGINEQQAADELFKNHQGIKDGISYPSLESYLRDWEHISPLLKAALLNATDEALDKRIEMGEDSMSFFELLTFMMYREANCIGQIALWRRLLGYDPIRYQ